ncbi:MAG: menaquinone biosynthetic enzyme MqnA/MqnD family protein, partial [Bacteroidota bacterium]
MKEKIKISLVSYTNTIPFRYGLFNFFTNEEVIIEQDIPAICAEKTINNKVDIGLVPIAVLSKHKNLKIISDFCIGSQGKVDSVMLYSQKPVNELQKIYLDPESKTSVQLVRILCQELWKTNPEFISATDNYINLINDEIGGVVIGDRTFKLKNRFNFEYDLSENWKKHTGLPFVFACWVCTSELENSFIEKFNSALSFGIKNIEKAVLKYDVSGLSMEDTLIYLKQRID